MIWKVACIVVCSIFGGLVLPVLLITATDWLWQRAHARRAMDRAVASMCKPCHGEAGTCTCPRKCGHPMCGAADTVISDKQFAAELAELLRKEEHRD